jgi:hypothetical protein
VLRRKLPVLWAAAIVLATVLACSGTALAITFGGVPDGNRHPNVGALVSESGLCTGTLISPTVLLTTAHCANEGDTVSVTFDPNPASNSPVYTGTFHPDPRYTGTVGDARTSEVASGHNGAVVVFERPVMGITPAQLPTLGQLERLPGNEQFTLVGYGVQWAVGTDVIPPGAEGGRREYATTALTEIFPDHLQLSSQNPPRGGACLGDSGGPNFLGAGSAETNVIAATTLAGSEICGLWYEAYRLDTQEARSFLGNYVVLP